MLEVRVSGPVSIGKTTATDIICNLMTDAGYDVQVIDGRDERSPIHRSTMRKLPATYTRTAVRLIDCETPEPNKENQTAALALALTGIGLVVLGVVVDGSVPYILTAIASSVLGVLAYKEIFSV